MTGIISIRVELEAMSGIACANYFIKIVKLTLRPDFTSNLVHGLAFGTPNFYIALYGKINHRLVNMSYNCGVKSDLRVSGVELKYVSNGMLCF